MDDLIKYCNFCKINHLVNDINYKKRIDGKYIRFECCVYLKNKSKQRINKRSDYNLSIGRDRNYGKHYIKNGSRRCNVCNCIFSLSSDHFHKNPTKPGGYKYICKECNSKVAFNLKYPGKQYIPIKDRVKKEKPISYKWYAPPKIMLWGLINYPDQLAEFEKDWSNESEKYKIGFSRFLKKYYAKIFKQYQCDKTKEKYYKNIEFEKSRVTLWKYTNPEKLKNWNSTRYNNISKNNDGTIGRTTLKHLLNNSDKCIYCDKILTTKNKSIDHIVPVSKGGNHGLNNIIICCKTCNCKKGQKEVGIFLLDNNLTSRNNIINKQIYKISNSNKQLHLAI